MRGGVFVAGVAVCDVLGVGGITEEGAVGAETDGDCCGDISVPRNAFSSLLKRSILDPK